jgi:hypothetical protein
MSFFSIRVKVLVDAPQPFRLTARHTVRVSPDGGAGRRGAAFAQRAASRRTSVLNGKNSVAFRVLTISAVHDSLPFGMSD